MIFILMILYKEIPISLPLLENTQVFVDHLPKSLLPKTLPSEKVKRCTRQLLQDTTLSDKAIYDTKNDFGFQTFH